MKYTGKEPYKRKSIFNREGLNALIKKYWSYYFKQLTFYLAIGNPAGCKKAVFCLLKAVCGSIRKKMQRMHILDRHNDIHHIPVGALERDV